MLKKKIWANFQRIVEVFTQKMFNMLSNIWVWDPGSGKTYFGSRIQGSKWHRIPDPDPQHCMRSHDLSPRPSPPSASWLTFLSFPVCLLAGEVAGGGWARSQIKWREKAWPSINHSISLGASFVSIKSRERKAESNKGSSFILDNFKWIKTSQHTCVTVR